MYKLISAKTGKPVDEKNSVTTDPATGSPLKVVYDYEDIKKRLNPYMIETTPISTRKYLDLFPINDYGNVVSLKEGNTPLYESARMAKDLGLNELYFKYEGANPTGSFKDRGSLVEVTKAIEMGAKKIILASTGNMAASVSAFSAKAGLECYIFIPEGTPPGKLAQSLSFGAKVIQIHGDYNTAATLAEKVAEKYGFFLAGDYAFRHEGQKTQGYEIIEQLLFKVPDYVLVPTGNGINISAIWTGFVEYKQLGFIDQLPKMIAVQATNVAPIAKRYNQKLKEFEVVKNPKTVASAIAVGDPLYGEMVLDLLRDSDGIAVTVSDEETLEAQHELAVKESIFTEPGGATVVAALKKLKESGKIPENSSYVCLLSGNGLKDPISPLKILADPPTIYPNLLEVDKILSSEILNVRSYGAKQREEVIFTKAPVNGELKKVLKKNFDYEADEEYIEEIRAQVAKFIAKGKRVNRADLQYIIENTVQTLIPESDKVLKLLDFEIKTEYGQSPQAWVKVSVKDEEIEAESLGTGPVDAAINALLKACKNGSTKEVELTDYNVAINTKGTDAAVDVNMTLECKKHGEKVVGKGTSPDIIQASIDAFLAGYNALHKD
ncbi:threonine synthase [Candidatus Dojkabacteria bacterium]|nr:threonine synthase [Candidatus Dojkabacteria bacterium]